ncbi:MAG: DNA polymerase ligase N-terminal domain-containing protein [Longimicrobiales bacterium]|nr:DNA polymerase ligase N-terminal domain-containing protein [Longimicrobiales bacterium]
MSLNDYKEKRDFGVTPEPKGGGMSSSNGRRFVIQEHDASSHHFDFRLEVDGELVSWSVPKGPSTDPEERRLAIRTENHPLEYADFEGVIPEDEYGGGTVIVWDRGEYRNLKEGGEGEEGSDGEDEAISMADQVDDGHITVWLEGEKLTGGYALTRTDQDDDEERWLLVKMDDEGADARRNPTSSEPESVKSGRTLDEVREAESDEEDG